MLERFKYVNHVGETIDFGTNGFFANSNDLWNYNWNYDKNKKSVTNFRKNAGTRTLPIVIIGNDKLNIAEKKNLFFEIVDKDVVSEKYGRIYIGDYYLNCYIVESSKSEYLKGNYLIMTVTLVTISDTWIKESCFEYIWHENIDTSGKGYPYRYEYNYTIGNGNIAKISNLHFAPCDFVMKISGFALNPAVTIGNHVYGVNETVQKNEILTIDTRYKTITLTKNNGVIVNTYAKRNKSSYIFEPIPAGEQRLYWNSNYNIEITLYEERGEPIWT